MAAFSQAVQIKNKLQSAEGALATTETSEWDQTIEAGLWGEWKGMVYTNEHEYYCGAQIRFEKSQGDGDDTAGNGLKLMSCSASNWYLQTEKVIYEGSWGDWKGWVMCPIGYYIYGAKVRFEKSQGDGDDTALNGLRIWCRNPITLDTRDDIEVYDGQWGDWKSA